MARATHHHRIPSIVSPLFWTIVGVSFSVLLLFGLFLLNTIVSSRILGDAIEYCLANIPVIFFISLLGGYANWLYKFRKSLAILAPLLASLSSILSVIFIFRLLHLLNFYFGVELFNAIYGLVMGNLFILFAVFLILGYLRFLVNFFRALFSH